MLNEIQSELLRMQRKITQYFSTGIACSLKSNKSHRNKWREDLSNGWESKVSWKEWYLCCTIFNVNHINLTSSAWGGFDVNMVFLWVKFPTLLLICIDSLFPFFFVSFCNFAQLLDLLLCVTYFIVQSIQAKSWFLLLMMHILKRWNVLFESKHLTIQVISIQHLFTNTEI